MYTLDQAKDKHIGIIGTEKRDTYEYELKMEILGEMIKQAPNNKRIIPPSFLYLNNNIFAN